MENYTGVFRCNFCENIFAVFQIDNKAAMKLALEETLGIACPKCGKYIDGHTLEFVFIIDTDEKVLKAARHDGTLYE